MKTVASVLICLSLVSLNFGTAFAAPKKKKPAATGQVQLPLDVQKALERERGQDTFANPQQQSPIRAFALSAKSADSGLESAPAGGGEKREQQESDIFKIGAPGSKLLYLLNNNRGLQIVSYAKGVNDPRLVGRVKATGNYPDNMYVDLKNSRILVLERNWVDNEHGSYSDLQSRIVVYDVKDPKLPRIVETIDVKGEIADSRMVGDVLYLATSIRPDFNSGGQQKGKGMVLSYKLDSEGVKPVEAKELSLPVSHRENMGITEVYEGGKYKYFLTAVLSESGWGWWDSQSQIEVVDISDAHGAIKPVMVASSKGFVDRRQQVAIKDGTLIVTSNYALQNDKPARWGQKLRVAVETFILPGEKPEVLTENESLYRKLHIERELDKTKETDYDKREEARAKLAADAELGVMGRFITDSTGVLKKLVPDSSVTVGDTTGQSANLRDVRYVGNQLHVFWVPGNLVDPFDLFDISKPREGVKYLNRTQFDGFIEKSRAFEYQGRQFVVGLGWIVDNVNNETNRRRPQAMLFEIIKVGNKLKAVDIAQMGLADANIWTDLNAQDKFVDIKMGADGRGMMMFKISSWGKDTGYRSGGKLIGFDLNQATADNGDTNKVFSEGGVLAGESGWLRRVFENTEIEKINTFSDKQLGTFDASEASVLGDPKAVAKAIHTLELARDIRSYAALHGGTKRMGVQIVSEGSSWYGSGEKAVTKLRVVNIAAADAELNAVAHEEVLSGSYVSHKVLADGHSMLVATRESAQIEKGGETIHQQIDRVFQLELIGESFVTKSVETVTEQNWSRHVNVPVVALENGAPKPVRISFDGASEGFIEIAAGEYLLSTGNDIKYVSTNASGPKLTNVEMVSTVMGENAHANLKVLGGKLYVTYTKLLSGDAKDAMRGGKVMIVQHFIAPVVIGADGKLTHGESVNIPGTPVAIFGTNHLVTEDDRLMDIEQKNWGTDEQPRLVEQAITERSLVSLKLENGKAVLVDSFHAEKLSAHDLKPADKGFVYVETAPGYSGNVGPWFGGRRIMPRFNDGGAIRLAGLSFDPNLYFKRDLKAIRGLELEGYVQLQFVTSDPATPGTYLGVLTNGSKGQIIRWNETNMVPEVVPVNQVNEQLAKNDATTMFDLPAGGYWSYAHENGKIHFNALERSLEVAGGMSGVCQIYLTEKNVKLK